MERFLNLLLQDDVLLKAIEKADADVEKAKRDADEKKWRIVADQMKILKVWDSFANTCISSSLIQSSPACRQLLPERLPRPLRSPPSWHGQATSRVDSEP
jgi:hypothetical protein